MSPERLGVAVVGLGVGEQHARAIAANDACRLAALVDIDPRRASTLAAALPCRPPVRSFDEVLADRAIGLVVLASYDDAHAEQVVAALDAGKHVFVEKPLCRTSAELARIRHAWRRHGGRARLASNLVLRAAPLYRWLRDEAASGGLGQLYAFDGDYLYGRLSKITDGWRGDMPGYSVMAGGGVHLVDLMMWICGERPRSVRAVGNGICTRGTAFRQADFVAATFAFASGLIGRVTAHFGCVHRHQHVVRVFGTAASVVHDDAGARISRERDPAPAAPLRELPDREPHKGALIAPLVEAILADRDPDPATRHDLDVMAACIAADESLRSGHDEEVGYA